MKVLIEIVTIGFTGDLGAFSEIPATLSLETKMWTKTEE